MQRSGKGALRQFLKKNYLTAIFDTNKFMQGWDKSEVVLLVLFMFQADIRYIFHLIPRPKFARSKGSDIALVISSVSKLY